MKWGLYLVTLLPPSMTQRQAIENSLLYALEAEKLGFDDVWTLEHHFTRYGLVGSPLLHAAYILGKTQRIKVGTAISVIPTDHPVRLAEQVALLDQLSCGRLYFGVGRGIFTKDFKIFNVDMGKSREMMAEWLEIMVRAWTTGKTAGTGKFAKFDEIDVYPEPYTKPHPPIYTVPQSPSSVEWAASHGYPMILNYAIEDEAKKAQLDLYAEVAESSGFDPETIPHALSALCGTAEDGNAIRHISYPNMTFWLDEYQRASDLLKPEGAKIPSYEYWQRMWEEAVIKGETKTDKRVEKYFRLNPIGSPDECIERLQRTIDVTGIDHVICGFETVPTGSGVIDSIRMFWDRVVPHIRPAKRGKQSRLAAG